MPWGRRAVTKVSHHAQLAGSTILPQSRRAISSAAAMDIRLLPVEQSVMMMRTESALHTITIYEGQPPIDFLRHRVAEMARANPWLAGSLVGAGGVTVLRHPVDPKGDCVEHLFYSPECGTVRNHRTLPGSAAVYRLPQQEGMSYSQMVAALRPMTVKTGATAVNKDEPVFCVSVLRQGKSKWWLSVSLSHVVGDAHTFYSLHNMLGESSEVKRMDAVRNRQAEARESLHNSVALDG